MTWLFDAMRREDGAIVTTDESEKVVSKLHFGGTSVAKFRFNYDSRVKEGTSTLLTLVAREITTDNDLHFDKLDKINTMIGDPTITLINENIEK